MVTPKARPRGITVTLCTGSHLASNLPIRAWPDSWYAVFLRSDSGMTMLLRSGPIRILSFAFSKSCISTVRALRRAAISAASLHKFARSAPDMPGVPRAMMPALTSCPSGTLRMCTFKICSLPRISGRVTYTWRSNRPGRSRAESKMSGRLVAATTITPTLVSKPSISTSI